MNPYERALKRIEEDAKCRRNVCCFGPTGPTARFNNSSNNIIHKFKQITFKFKKRKYR